MITVLHDAFTMKFEIKQHIDIINNNITALMKGYQLNKILCTLCLLNLLDPDPNDPVRRDACKNEAEFLSYLIISRQI